MLDEVLIANLSTEVDITSNAVESRSPEYPIAALQQLVRNAILHRSYESTNAPVRIYWFRDRIEIHNPGSLFGQVDRQNFGTGVTDYRNPHLAEAIKNLGYVQRFGFGIALARRALAQNGNPPPEFAIEDTYFAVTVRRKS
jgi:ATP-dependent DNA helicase RecG